MIKTKERRLYPADERICEANDQAYVPHSRKLFYYILSLIALFCDLTLLSAHTHGRGCREILPVYGEKE